MQAESRRLYEQSFEKQDFPFLYAAPWWLDATCGGGEGWDYRIVKDPIADNIAIIPFHRQFIRGMAAVTNPPMSQWLPILKNTDNPQIAITDFIKSLPKYSILDISFKPDENLQQPSVPFQVNYKYTFIIASTETKEKIKAKYNEGLRRNLKEANQHYTIDEADDMATFLELCMETYHQRKMKAPAWLSHVSPAVYRALKANQCGKIEFAFHNGKAIAGVMIGWDRGTSYYLLGGRTADEGGASAHALLLDKAIMEANLSGRSFDFEGSMQSGVANFFQSFGATPIPYWQVRRFKGPGILWSIFRK